MKFKKPTEQRGKDTVATAGGVIAGSMVSRAFMGMIDKPEENVDTKKAENATLMKRGALVLAGGIAAACVDGSDTVSMLIKGLAIGVAAQQSLEAIKTISAKSSIGDAATATTTGKKALRTALGLGCPCDGNGLNARRRNKRGLRYTPVLPEYVASNMDFAEAPQPVGLLTSSSLL